MEFKKGTILIELLAKDKDVILYRKELNIITGSVTATILLQQIIFRYVSNENKAFYKFIEPCKHEKYKDGDSWCEELGFTRKEFLTAIKKLEDAGLVSKKTNMQRLTFYTVNLGDLDKALKGIYVNAKRGFIKMPKGDLDYIDTENTTENTTDIKKIYKKSSNLVDEFENETELSENAKELLNDFVDYRKKIKKPLKTIQPLKIYLAEIRAIYKNGFDVKEAIELMKSNEWQSIKLEWIQNIKKNNQQVAVKTENKTFYQQTEEQKQQKQQQTLSNIAKVRELREQGLL